MRLFPLALAAGLLSGCGYVASPLPPFANVPARVSDLAAIQRGGSIVVQFTVPRLTTDGVAIKPPLELDLRIGPGPTPWNENEWADRANPISEAPASASGQPLGPGASAHYQVPAAEWIGKDIVVAVRTAGENGKVSGWSNLANLAVIAPPERPSNITHQMTPAGLHLTWQARGDHFRVLRSTGSSSRYDVVATVTQPEWTDPNAQAGTPYRYLVQTFVTQSDNREAQSELSEPLALTPEPIAPSAPTGLRAVPAPNSIELSWEGSSEVTGYRIYRGEPGGPLEKIGETGPVPSYSDRTAPHAHNFRYAVTAVSASGKESPQSPYFDVAYP
ncbi:MAG TPA: hypothetical protein VKB88_08925 [Bryobacteraceae bacterium]|nr:hypothetical protein [Bryobacteraceae bacterium]